jgi:Putative amidoligase enzyme
MSLKVKTKVKVTKGMLEAEQELKDLLEVVPILAKYKIEGHVIGKTKGNTDKLASASVLDKIRKLRLSRKSIDYSLEVSRKFGKEEIKKEASFTRDKKGHVEGSKFSVLKQLKQEINNEIKARRDERRFKWEKLTCFDVEVEKLSSPYSLYKEPGFFIQAQEQKLIRGMETIEKFPKDDRRYVGLEFEFASALNVKQLCKLFGAEKLAKYLYVKTDQSIQTEEGHPHKIEVTALIPEMELRPVMERLCRVLNEQTSIKINKSCGLHVHLDMRTRDHVKAFNNLVKSQALLYAMLPAARRISKYSYPVTNGSYWRVLPERYHGVNNVCFARTKTIELRMHSGTSSFRKIVMWVESLIKIADAPAMGETPTNPDRLAMLCSLTEEQVAYMKSRIKKFATQHQALPKIKVTEPIGTMPEVETVLEDVLDVTEIENSEVA